MKKVVNAYPEDLDAATLYAESILDLDPWKWWTNDGKAKEGTMEAIEKLEFVLNRDPVHIGANHYYIHAWEESPSPERALMSAKRLEYILQESGHLLHMSCHIFLWKFISIFTNGKRFWSISFLQMSQAHKLIGIIAEPKLSLR